MSKKPIYVDMDNVLLVGVFDPVTEEPLDIILRPGLDQFLKKMKVYGDLTLLTAASSSWAKMCLHRMGSISRIFSQVVTAEDLYPISLQIEVVDKSSGLTPQDKDELYRQIEPILPPGVIFDDYWVDSGMYWLKGLAAGIVYLNPSLWIQVEKFDVNLPDRGGLEKAYLEFKKRNVAWRERPVMGSKKLAIKIA